MLQKADIVAKNAGLQVRSLAPEVQQRVPDHRQVHEAFLSSSANACSNAPHNTCTATRCASWTVADAAGTHNASSTTDASGFGVGPVIAQLTAPARRAASAARTTFGLVPLVDSSTTMSPGRACPVT